LFDRDEQALPWAGSQVGIVVAPDGQMRLVAISDAVVAEGIGDPVDTLTAAGGVVFFVLLNRSQRRGQQDGNAEPVCGDQIFGFDRALAVWACVDYRRGWARQAYGSVASSVRSAESRAEPGLVGKTDPANARAVPSAADAHRVAFSGSTFRRPGSSGRFRVWP
jgi:hypothetical protein